MLRVRFPADDGQWSAAPVIAFFLHHPPGLLSSRYTLYFSRTRVLPSWTGSTPALTRDRKIARSIVVVVLYVVEPVADATFRRITHNAMCDVVTPLQLLVNACCVYYFNETTTSDMIIIWRSDIMQNRRRANPPAKRDAILCSSDDFRETSGRYFTLDFLSENFFHDFKRRAVNRKTIVLYLFFDSWNLQQFLSKCWD